MSDFLRFYNQIAYHNGFRLEIYNSSINGWCITIGYKLTCNQGEDILHIQDTDMELAFAKAQVELKKWMLKNKGGY